jgi:hypothetical protein
MSDVGYLHASGWTSHATGRAWKEVELIRRECPGTIAAWRSDDGHWLFALRLEKCRPLWAVYGPDDSTSLGQSIEFPASSWLSALAWADGVAGPKQSGEAR